MKWIKDGQFVPESWREFFVLILADIFIHDVEKNCKDIIDVCCWDKDGDYWRQEIVGTDSPGSPGFMRLF